jgi:hypothetical protein
MLFAVLVLAGCWVFGDFSVQLKLILTGIYAVTWGLEFLLPGLGMFLQFLFALALYFATFGTSRPGRWRP